MNTPNHNTWKDRLPACFGVHEVKFAWHPDDEERAKEMAREARESGASSEEILSAIRDYLVSKGARPEHIDEEMVHARKFVA
jgi:hypothetical protein